MENKITVIKDSLQTPDFQRWRFVPVSKNILFNFKDVVSSEEEAIELVVKCYKEDMRGVRRLRSSHMTKWNWIIIEVCFLNEKARLRALKQGVTTTSGVKITPQTACIDTILYTCLTFNGLALLPTIDEIKSDIVEWSKSVIDNANDSQRYFGSNISFTADDALLVWMGVDSDGLYRGTGGVLFRGYDSKLADRVRHQYFGFEQASTYPNVSVNVKYGYMYCDTCEILNDHESADCVANFDGCESPISGSTLTTTESPKSLGKRKQENQNPPETQNKTSFRRINPKENESDDSEEEGKKIPGQNNRRRDDQQAIIDYLLADEELRLTAPY